MIVLDTNVVSELARPAPDQRVIDWVDGQDSSDLVITVVTAAEVRAGVALLPEGRRITPTSSLPTFRTRVPRDESPQP